MEVVHAIATTVALFESVAGPYLLLKTRHDTIPIIIAMISSHLYLWNQIDPVWFWAYQVTAHHVLTLDEE